MTRAFLPLLKRSKGAIVNNVSLLALSLLPLTPAYCISKVTVDGVFLGPVDTDMTRGFEIPKAAPDSVAQGIFAGLEKNEEDIFPDPMSQFIAEAWRTGIAKAF